MAYNSLAQTISTLSSTANTTFAAAAGQTNPNTFKVPAHKHAHHLHSIPPREKSTRTLIIDHMLWVHARTRFAQARAELAMGDPTGGPSTPFYQHRTRPEEYDEEDEAGSEGEDLLLLQAMAGTKDHEDERLLNQDLELARTLRLRADGLEKVVTGMLLQPPPLHPVVEDFLISPPTSPKIAPPGRSQHQHTLPNGVRLRLALGTVINDLFARPSVPLRRERPREYSETNTTDHIQLLPAALEHLSCISAYTLTSSSHVSSSVRSKIPLKPGTRTQLLYSAGVDPETANSTADFRCSRHLHHNCQICDAKFSSQPSVSPRLPAEKAKLDGGGITGYREGIGIGSGLARPGIDGTILRRKGSAQGNIRVSELLPRFLRLSALVAAELGLEIRDKEESKALSKESNGRTSPMWTDPRHMEGELSPLPGPSSSLTVNEVAQAQQEQMHSYALRPTREWYMLFAGLLTRATLEGYLTAGWRRSDAAECLLTCGMGLWETIRPVTERKLEFDEETTEEFAEFDPDDFPSLLDSVRVLFPGTRGEKFQAEEEFIMELDERLHKFYDIPASTPDLSTHMEDLAWQYPAEPVERAALRFCETLARWRGKPEIETYKKRDPAKLAKPRKYSVDRYFMMPSYSPSTWNSARRTSRAADDPRLRR